MVLSKLMEMSDREGGEGWYLGGHELNMGRQDSPAHQSGPCGFLGKIPFDGDSNVKDR